MDAVTQPLSSQSRDRNYQYANGAESSSSRDVEHHQMSVEIIEQPVSDGARFRYKCEGRSAGCIRGVNSTEKQKTYPTIKVHGYQGAAGVVVSCVTKDGPPYYPHPHNLVGKTCTNGVCYKPINNLDMVCSFSNLGIQCVKRRDIKDSLSQREALQVDPCGTGFHHHSEPSKINLNALRLCFQVFIPNSNGKLCVPLPPVISNPIFDNKTVSDLTITKLSHSSAPAVGGQEIILLCDQVNKDDIQIIFYEESDDKVSWTDLGKFSPHHVHRKAAISFQTPPYKNPNIQQQVNCFIHLRRPSDGTVGKPRAFSFLPYKKDPEGIARKRNKFEALRLDKVLHLSNFPTESNAGINPLSRVIIQAVRTKPAIQNRPSNNISPNYPENSSQPMSSMLQSINYNENIPLTSPYSHQRNTCQPHSMDHLQQHPHQRVDDLLAVASEQMGFNSTQTYTESSVVDTLDKLSSLDLGLNSSDLDVNLSSIILDSFSDSPGFNFSLSFVSGKNSEVQFQDGAKLQDQGSCS